jgi:endonuclease/exonuclease/phosphatase family metal-dependent hydrolase
MSMTALTWNLFHGRSEPPAGRQLLAAFGDALASWDWDVACLQEVPPWWPRPLAERCGASMRMALTSRNALLPARKALAIAFPDAVKSEGGGCNAILVRGAPIDLHRTQVLAEHPERRVVHAVRAGGIWVANIHASKQEPRARSLLDVEVASAAIGFWARDAPVVWGGDFNIRDPAPAGWEVAASSGVDHLLVRGLEPAEHRVLDAGPLSDHAPLLLKTA